MTTQYEEKEVYVLLDFQGKVPSATFRQPKVFFNMYKLDRPNPIVQVGKHVYEGTYEKCLGTNMFFEEVENPPPSDIYEQEASIKLQYVVKQCKVLKMKEKRLSQKYFSSAQKTTELPSTGDCIKEFSDDYQTVVNKIQEGLDIEDYITSLPDKSGEILKTNNEHPVKPQPVKAVFKVPKPPPKKKIPVKYDEPYSRLQKLAREANRGATAQLKKKRS